ncbi:unnamed protein product, partial [Choristocarpus tenellus]
MQWSSPGKNGYVLDRVAEIEEALSVGGPPLIPGGVEVDEEEVLETEDNGQVQGGKGGEQEVEIKGDRDCSDHYENRENGEIQGGKDWEREVEMEEDPEDDEDGYESEEFSEEFSDTNKDETAYGGDTTGDCVSKECGGGIEKMNEIGRIGGDEKEGQDCKMPEIYGGKNHSKTGEATNSDPGIALPETLQSVFLTLASAGRG